MKTFVATLTIILLLAAFLGIVTAEEAEQETEQQPTQMPMMQGMMGGGQGGMQGGMMSQMPMMGGMMGGMMSQMHRMPTPQMLLSLSDELKLEEEEVKSIQKIGLDLQKGVIQKNADHSIAEIELNALLSQDEIDLEQARQKIQQIATLEGELRIAQISASFEAKKVLTNEQRAKLKEITQKSAAMHTPKKAASQKEKKVEKKSMH